MAFIFRDIFYRNKNTVS